jgi:hypothetical protein
MANKGSFTPGDPRAGRKKGSMNNIRKEIRQLCHELVSNPDYVAALRQRLIEGKCTLEPIIWQWAYGEPPKHAPSPLDDFFDEQVQMHAGDPLA